MSVLRARSLRGPRGRPGPLRRLLSRLRSGLCSGGSLAEDTVAHGWAKERTGHLGYPLDGSHGAPSVKLAALCSVLEEAFADPSAAPSDVPAVVCGDFNFDLRLPQDQFLSAMNRRGLFLAPGRALPTRVQQRRGRTVTSTLDAFFLSPHFLRPCATASEPASGQGTPVGACGDCSTRGTETSSRGESMPAQCIQAIGTPFGGWYAAARACSEAVYYLYCPRARSRSASRQSRRPPCQHRHVHTLRAEV